MTLQHGLVHAHARHGPPESLRAHGRPQADHLPLLVRVRRPLAAVRRGAGRGRARRAHPGGVALHAGPERVELVGIPGLDPIDERHRVLGAVVKLRLRRQDVLLEVRDEHGDPRDIWRAEGPGHVHAQAARETVQAPLHFGVGLAGLLRDEGPLGGEAKQAVPVEHPGHLRDELLAEGRHVALLRALVHHEVAADGPCVAGGPGAGRRHGGAAAVDPKRLLPQQIPPALILPVHGLHDAVPHLRKERREVLRALVVLHGAARAGVGEHPPRKALRDFGDRALHREVLPPCQNRGHAQERATRLIPDARVGHEQEGAHEPKDKPNDHIDGPRAAIPETRDLRQRLLPKLDCVQRHHLLPDRAEDDEGHRHFHRQEDRPEQVPQDLLVHRHRGQVPQLVGLGARDQQLREKADGRHDVVYDQRLCECHWQHGGQIGGPVVIGQPHGGVGRNRGGRDRGPAKAASDSAQRATPPKRLAAGDVPLRDGPQQAVHGHEQPNGREADGEAVAL
mmetsp:Transcript_79952/g.244424  ORF Transcript_79952/g.244424 Transcript_79952/m.244424 type:complete len:507 (-) Transcript_79952:889-2409(-)